MPPDEVVSGPETGAADRLDLAWGIDRIAHGLILLGGLSGIVFVLGIFGFVTKEGLGFMTHGLDLAEFFGSPNWRPTSDNNPTYGALALMAGTASVTGLAMLVSVRRSLAKLWRTHKATEKMGKERRGGGEGKKGEVATSCEK